MRIVRWAVNLSLRPASCCSVEVLNGGYGLRLYGLRSTLRTEKSESARSVARARAAFSSKTMKPDPDDLPSEPKSLPVATRTPSSADSVAMKVSPEAEKVPSRSQ